MRRLLQFALPVGILLVGVLIFVIFVRTKPEAAHIPPADQAPLVLTEAVRPVTEPVTVHVQGTVVPSRRVQLTPQVNGKIEWVNPDFVPGGRVERGDTLFRIEGDDYRLGLKQAQSNVQRAQVELAMERGRKQVAEQEFRAFARTATEAESNPLILREPQLQAAKSALEAAKSGVEQARLALERTHVSAPFNALVLAESVEVGQTVGPQPVATLVGTDTFWIQAAVSVDKLAWIQFPVGDQEGSKAVITQDIGRQQLRWNGRVIRLIGDLEQGSRMARILIEVEDPLALKAEGISPRKRLPLLIGAFVNVDVEGPVLENVYRISRKGLRENNLVYVVTDENRLAIREVNIAWRTQEFVLVESGVSPGDLVVLSTLSTPIEGMKLRAESVAANAAASQKDKAAE